MPEIIVFKVPSTESLEALSRHLWQQKVSHRIIEEEGEQHLLVGNQQDAEYVYQCYQQSKEGDSFKEKNHQPAKKLSLKQLNVPVTLVSVVLSVLGFFLVYLDSDYGLVKYLTFFHFDRSLSGQIIFAMPQGDYWRMFTPIFLHFSMLHIVFNMLWLWDLGRRIETLQGSYRMLGIVLLIGMGSNITQALFAEVGVFGGMSGVIYGLLGYGWVWSALRPHQSLHIPPVVINFMLIWLVACMLGVATLLGAGAVANAAHLGGLVMGMLLGAVAALIAPSVDD
jgi:GlpG protein